jgi:hypothetical protein
MGAVGNAKAQAGVVPLPKPTTGVADPCERKPARRANAAAEPAGVRGVLFPLSGGRPRLRPLARLMLGSRAELIPHHVGVTNLLWLHR